MIVLYYIRLRRVNERYEEARDVVKDIIISFNSQLRLLEESVKKIAYKLESLPVKSGDVTAITNQVRKYEKKLSDITSKVNAILTLKDRIEKLDKKVAKLEEDQTKIAQEMAKSKEIQIGGVIPIRREQALAPLTSTELRVLEILADEGQKTAPEIRNRIGLTREHTARLMKKLYEKGYIERNETKTPFIYSIKEEMREILKKTSISR
jgi:DNA-binding MarR family transcriptional regulator